MVDFIRALRAGGVRVSLAESQDAFAAAQTLGMLDREAFRSALRASLIKQRGDLRVFEKLFPQYFRAGAPPMLSAAGELTEDDMAVVQAALEMLSEELRQLLERLLEGRSLKDLRSGGAAPLEIGNTFEPTDQTGTPDDPIRRWLAHKLLRQLASMELQAQLQALLELVGQLGMSPQGQQNLAEILRANLEALQQQAQDAVGPSPIRYPYRPPSAQALDRLMDRPFRGLSRAEQAQLREEVTRLAARLRTRLALRQRRGDGPRLDAKATMRRVLRYGGVPFEILTRRRRRRAKFTLICDVSTSMRPVVEFLLLLLYHIQDQVERTRSFAFIDHIEEISDPFQQYRPEVAVPIVLRQLPPGYYNTDLGRCLQQFTIRHLASIDRRTTLIVCGDGRNNYLPARVELLEALARRAGRSAWFNPEPPHRWGTDDSDMLSYLPAVDVTFQVSNLRQLGQAIDRLLT